MKGHEQNALEFCKQIMPDPFLGYYGFIPSKTQRLAVTSQYSLLLAAQMHSSVITAIHSWHLTITKYPHQARLSKAREKRLLKAATEKLTCTPSLNHLPGKHFKLQ